MWSELLKTECDTLLAIIEVEDNNIELLVESNNLLWVAYAAPREVSDVDKTIYATEVDEYTVGSDVLNSTLKDLTLLELRHDKLLLSLELCLDKSLVRDNNIAELLVDLNNLELHSLINIYVVVANWLNVDLRTWKECLDAEYINDHTALSAALNITLDDLVLLQSLINTIPALELTSLLVREDELTALVLYRLYINLYLVANLQLRVVTELRCCDNALALVADVYDYLALVDLGNGTLYGLTYSDV